MNDFLQYSKKNSSDVEEAEKIKATNNSWYEWFNGKVWTIVTGSEVGEQVSNYTKYMKNNW